MRRDKGQGLVEFALILPILLLTVLAFIYLANLFHTWSALQSAAVVGARQAARSGTIVKVEKTVYSYLQDNAVDVSDVKIKVAIRSPDGHLHPAPPRFGDWIEVRVRKPYDIEVLGWRAKGSIQGVHRLICEHGGWSP